MRTVILMALCLMTWSYAFAQNQETRALSSFDKVKIRGLSQVILQQGTEEKVELTSKNGNLKDVKVKVNKKGFLVIQRKLKILKNIRFSSRSYNQNDNIKAILTFKSLSYLSNSGSGDVIVSSPVAAKEFVLKNSGSGNIAISSPVVAEKSTLRNSGSGFMQCKDLKIDYLEAKVSGSGKIKVLEGSVQKQKLRVTGSGTMNMLGLESEEAETQVSGSGNLYLHVIKTHNSKVTGSGDVRYKGNPETNTAVTRGSGDIRQLQSK